MFFRKKKDKKPDFNPDEKINYNEFDLLDELHVRAFASFEHTLETVDFVPQNYIDKVYKRIFKALKKEYKKDNKINKEYQKWFKAQMYERLAERRKQLQQSELQQLKQAQKDGDNEQKKSE